MFHDVFLLSALHVRSTRDKRSKQPATTAIMKTLHLLASICLLLPSADHHAVVLAQEEKDDVVECEGWASSGECSLNPTYMSNHCPIACQKQAENDQRMAEEIGEFM